MPARDTDKSTDATTSTSATDASTTQGRAAALGTDKPADPTRVVVEQAPAEPAVFYGEGGIVPGSLAATDPNKPHVQADYQPFKW